MFYSSASSKVCAAAPLCPGAQRVSTGMPYCNIIILYDPKKFKNQTEMFTVM